MARGKDKAVNRRTFLRSAAVGAAALVAAPGIAEAKPRKSNRGGGPLPMSQDAEVNPPSKLDVLTEDRSGSDFMVDVLKSLDIDYICSNPGSSIRGLHESIINYGRNQKPEFITCLHEESSVGMAHGYAKVEGKPIAVLAHGTVGLQHASMAIYNAFCDRVPVYIIVGNNLEASKRKPGVEWDHSVQDAAAMVRDYVKWDDQPISLTDFAESAARAYKIAMTPPMMPVLLVADAELQENPIANDAAFHIPKIVIPSPPQGDMAAVAEAARLLVAAEKPVIIADRVARTPAGMMRVVELAEALQAPVIDQAARLNFPTRHPLNQTERGRGFIAEADVILGLEVVDFYGTVHSFRDQVYRTASPTTQPNVKLISISTGDLYTKSNYQDFQRYAEVDLAIAADAEATLPSLTEQVKRLSDDNRKTIFRERGAQLAKAQQSSLKGARAAATYAWDASPISTARLSQEIWAQIKDHDWSLVSAVQFLSNWPLRLWNFDKPYQFIGAAGGFGIGYGAPAAVGAALANRKYGRLSVNIQGDGDLMYAPGILWTSARHRIPVLNIMHNNRAYHQEVMQIQIMANRHNRGIDRAGVGTTMTDPNIDFKKIAEGMGVYAEGPISDPKDLGPALRRAIHVVESGQPALVDVLTQPR
jgi:thiamine pyrophosphate-dependent acetolactate synthase large subunit-like protein